MPGSPTKPVAATIASASKTASMARASTKSKVHKRSARRTAKVASPMQPSAVDVLSTRASELGLSPEQNAFVSSLLSTIETLSSANTHLSNERAALAAALEISELRVKKLTLLSHGKRTEKLTREELAQLALALGATEEQANAQQPQVPHEPVPDEAVDDEKAEPEPSAGRNKQKKKKPRPNHPGRTKLSPDLERVRLPPVTVPAEERLCACCQHEMQVVGYVEHERVEHVPAKIVVHVERREKRACRRSDCRGDITTAPRDGESGSRRRIGTSLLAHLIESKCDDGLPLERQRDQLRRLGFEVPANTLYTNWTYATSLLLRVAEIHRAQVCADPIVCVDDTSLKVLDKTRKGGIFKGHLWCFAAGTRKLVAYTFTPSWSADEVAPYLMAIDGFVQCDDYKGYSRKVTLDDGTERVLVDPARRLGCLMHVRRRFHEALKLGDKRAARGIELIGAIYDIERIAKTEGLTPEQRLQLRTDWSLPLLDVFDAWVDDLVPKCLPKSPLGEALGYAQHQRPYVRRCFTDGRFEIDNGHTERILREPCMGRKAYLFSGSAEAAERLAGAYSLVQSCRLLGFSARDYLIDVLNKLEAGWPVTRLGELVPDRWAIEHRPTLLANQAQQELQREPHPVVLP